MSRLNDDLRKFAAKFPHAGEVYDSKTPMAEYLTANIGQGLWILVRSEYYADSVMLVTQNRGLRHRELDAWCPALERTCLVSYDDVLKVVGEAQVPSPDGLNELSLAKEEVTRLDGELAKMNLVALRKSKVIQELLALPQMVERLGYLRLGIGAMTEVGKIILNAEKESL